MEQAPINLPPPKKSIKSKLSPIFKYEETEVVIKENSSDGSFKSGDNLRIDFENGALRIKAPSFGRVVTLDGGVYEATEIIFNTIHHNFNMTKLVHLIWKLQRLLY